MERSHEHSTLSSLPTTQTTQMQTQFSGGRVPQLGYGNGHLNTSLLSRPIEQRVDQQQQLYLQALRAMTSVIGSSNQGVTPSSSLTLSSGPTPFTVDHSGTPQPLPQPLGNMISASLSHGLVAPSVPLVAVNADWARLALHQLHLQQQQQHQQRLVDMQRLDRGYMQSLLTRRIPEPAVIRHYIQAPKFTKTAPTTVPVPVEAPVVAPPPAPETTPPETTNGSTLIHEGASLLCHPVRLALPEDVNKLSSLQVLLRHQIEAFPATEELVMTHARGRTKKVRVGQVGIRCRHCTHLPLLQHRKGSTYFPTTVQGFYQASQNMAAVHLQNGACSAMPSNLKDQFANLLATKGFISGAGRQYWTNGAHRLGLVDTEQGIFFAGYIPFGVRVVEESDVYRTTVVPIDKRPTSVYGQASSNKRIKK